MLDTGKISQTTHSLFTREIDDALAEIENQRKALLGKMSAKTMELEEHVRTLEILLANFEIQHVVGEVDDETYNRQTDILSAGLETAKKELGAVQDAVNQLSNDEEAMEQDVETSQTQLPDEVAVAEEPTQAAEKEGEPEQTVVETIQGMEEAQGSETRAEEKQQA